MDASKYLLFTILVTSLIAVACKKNPPEAVVLPDPESPSIRLTTIKSTHAVLQATYLSTIVDSGIIGNITYLQGIAFAEFRNSSGQITNPAEVFAEGTKLTFDRGIFRTYPGNTQGIDFGSIISWKVTGNQQIPDIDEDIAAKVPEIGDVSVKDSIDGQKDLWLGIKIDHPFTSLGPQVDSVQFLIAGKKKLIQAQTAGTDSILFPKSEISNLGSGKAYIYAEAWFTTLKNYSDYKVAFVNKGVLIKEVWIY